MKKVVRDYVCLDLEMTGLSSKLDKILEIGAVKVVEGVIVDEFSTLINPGVRIEDKIVEITGINNKMVENQPYIEDILPEFIDFCGDCVIIGHNLMFDYAFLKRNAVNAGLSFERHGIDTLKIARKHLSELEKRTLGYLCQYYHIENYNYHRALNDAVATHMLYRILCDGFYSENDSTFKPEQLIYKVKKEVPATADQIKNLKNLMKYHKIEIGADINRLTKSEATRCIHKIILKYGRIK